MHTITTLQIFIYNLSHEGIDENNRYPMLRFSSHSDKYTLISKLQSSPERRTQNPYFVINNPQLLPTGLRAKHQYPINNAQPEPTPETPPLVNYIDGVFYFTEENIELLRDCDIDNNVLSEEGFREFMDNYDINT
jgi:hypothetical protein